MQQPTDQRPRVEVDQFLLPGDELDLPFVLPPGPVLREQARPVLGEGVDLPAALVPLPDPADFVREDLRHRELAQPDQLGVTRRAGDAELVHVARTSGETSIAEVEPQKIRIRGERKGLRVSRTDSAGAPLTPEIWSAPTPPVPYGTSGDPCPPRDLAVVPAGSDKLEGKRNFLFGAHFATLLSQARVA
jgi:hypothetical protein